MTKYRLREAIVGELCDADGHIKVFTLPAGAVLTLQDTTLESGLVDARWRDQTIAVFLEDLKARADLMETVSG